MFLVISLVLIEIHDFMVIWLEVSQYRVVGDTLSSTFVRCITNCSYIGGYTGNLIWCVVLTLAMLCASYSSVCSFS